MSKKLHIVSLGCTKNLVDTEVMLGKLREYEITDDASEADVLIVNTCGFINSAKEESINTIFELDVARKEGSILAVSGCLSERYKEELQEELQEVDIFTGVGDYDKIDVMLEERKSLFTPKTYLIDEEERVISNSNYHAYIKISEGCNQQCSFCAIPSFKGKLQSRALESITKEVRALVAKGYYDFTFVSQDSSSYLRDFGMRDGLIALVEAIEKIEGVKSARILYLYPSTTSLALIDRIIASPLFHNYFDMPIQHINDAMLKSMKRGTQKEGIIALLGRMRDAKSSFLRTSVIVGHPRETKLEYQELREFIETFGFDRVNVFAYSDEENTASCTMDGKVIESIIDDRAQELGAVVSQITKQSLDKLVGSSLEAVIEGESSEGEMFFGAKVLAWDGDIDGEILINDSDIEDLQVGVIYRVEISERVGDKLLGKVSALA